MSFTETFFFFWRVGGYFYPRSIFLDRDICWKHEIWHNGSASSAFEKIDQLVPRFIILLTSVIFSKIENRQAFFKVIDTRKKRDFSILFSDSEGRKKRLSHG